MKLVEWVDMVKATGGVPDTSPDTLAALRAAATLCWAALDQMGKPHTETAQLGVKWTAAFMVSCARHGTTDLCSILVPSDQRHGIFSREAALLHKLADGQGSLFPGRIYPAASVTGMPSAV